ncbi:MAG: alkaline phosphatase family protein [Alphaproteobacteria bacterium]|nr:alkaline phosphatase family protein [Alphaproteobacteria bacterium]
MADGGDTRLVSPRGGGGFLGALRRIVLLGLAFVGLVGIVGGLALWHYGEIPKFPVLGLETTQNLEEPASDHAPARFQPAKLEVLPGVRSVAPQTPWLKLDDSAELTRIGVGSCLSQSHPQPIWDGVLRLEPRPQLFLMAGDNVYGDIRSPGAKELVQAYRDQGVRPELARARQAIPFLAIWDDHDYGGNDKGATFSQKVQSAKLFHDFWQMQPQRPFGRGIYYSKTYGPAGRRVQFIMLDTRSFRSKLKKKSRTFNVWGKYQPSYDPEATMLGKAQWDWLEQALQEEADVRIIVSSVQLLAGGHGFERWGNFPRERQRLFQLIDDTGATGAVIVSGDRHFGAFYVGKLNNGQVLPEITASSLNRSYGPSKDGPSAERISDMYHQENFGLIDIDWRLRRVSLKLMGVTGEMLDSLTVKFEDLGIDN